MRASQPPPRRRGEAFLFKKSSKCGPSIATLPESGVASRAPGIKPRRVWPPVANTNSVHWQYGNSNDNSLTPAQGTARGRARRQVPVQAEEAERKCSKGFSPQRHKGQLGEDLAVWAEAGLLAWVLSSLRRHPAPASRM